jgi:hypothetical protein
MIDLHCHLDLYPNPAAVAKECARRRMYVLSVTTTPSAWKGTNALATGANRIRTAVGLHPQLARERKGELDQFERLIQETRYVGEIGLDGTPECKPSGRTRSKCSRMSLTNARSRAAEYSRFIAGERRTKSLPTSNAGRMPACPSFIGSPEAIAASSERLSWIAGTALDQRCCAARRDASL